MFGVQTVDSLGADTSTPHKLLILLFYQISLLIPHKSRNLFKMHRMKVFTLDIELE